MTEEEAREYKEDAAVDTNFEAIKDVASQNIGSMLKDLTEFEEAIRTENIPAIYRIYKGRLHQELKNTANKDHEIDGLLMKKLHDSFLQAFPFMKLTQKVNPTVQYYQLGNYYHERPTIGLDASIPEIFVLPEIEEEWQTQQADVDNPLTAVEKQMDALTARSITAESELVEVDEQLQTLRQALEEKKEASKGFFNRSKTDEDVAELTQQIGKLTAHQEELQRFVNDKQQLANQKEKLMNHYQALRLQRAIITKELRLINRQFDSFSSMGTQLQAFMKDYLDERGVCG